MICYSIEEIANMTEAEKQDAMIAELNAEKRRHQRAKDDIFLKYMPHYAYEHERRW